MQEIEGDDDQLLRPRDAAARLSTTTATLRVWMTKGALSDIVLPNGQRRYRADEVRAIARGEYKAAQND